MEFSEKQSICNKRRLNLIERQTGHESQFRDILDATGIKYIFQKGFIAGKNFCIVDFYIPKKKVCIEIDGKYHESEKQKKRDLNRDFYLTKQRGFSVIHIENESLNTFNSESLSLLINEIAGTNSVRKF